MKKRLIVFNGIHGAGKSSVISQLGTEKSHCFSVYPEIGRMVRESVNYNALESGVAFDLEVRRRELERDRQLRMDLRTPLVETWHVGNIAYALTRSPEVADMYKRDLYKALEVFDPTFVYVDIGWETFRKRISEKVSDSQRVELEAFYKEIKRHLFDLYAKLEKPMVEVKNEVDLRIAVREVESFTMGAEKHGLSVERW